MILVKRIFFVLFLFSIETALSEPVKTDPPAVLNAEQVHIGKEALLKMIEAMQSLSFQGTVVFFKDGKLEPMRYFHAFNNGVEQERLVSLNSPLREIIRDAGKVSCVYKATQQVVVNHRPFERSFLIDFPKDLDVLSVSYDVDIVGDDSVALLPAYVISIKPKDKLRYERTIWVDKEHFLPIKVVINNFSSTTLEQYVFTDLEIKSKLPFVDVKVSSADNPVQSLYKLQAQSLEQAAFTVTKLPQGFREIFFTRRPMHNSEQPVDHLLLSDGLASVSVYMEHKNSALKSGLFASKSVESVGAVNFFSQTLGDYELTVMGEVPAETVKLIAEGVKLRSVH